MRVRKKIALIVDSDNWAFANIAKNVKQHLSKYYDFDIIPVSYLDYNLVKLLILVKEYDLIHFFWRGHINDMRNNFFSWYIENMGTTKEKFEQEYLNYNKITTAVYDHLYINKDKEISKYIFGKVKNYYVSSIKLFDIYNKLDIKNKPNCVITDGTDLDKFYPINLERFENIDNRTIKIGWVGNSKWSNGKKDIKGLKTIIDPVIKELIKEEYNIEASYADSQIKRIPLDNMVNYYSNIDIYVCCSENEGTPNPVLESMACGVPIISTDVGIVKEALGKKQKKYILKNRSKKDLKEMIIKLINNKSELKELSQENLKRIKDWTWDKKAKDFKRFFDSCLKGEENDNR